MSASERVQSVRNAWVFALRAEVLRRQDVAELPRIACIASWLATYADADGGGAYPSRETLADLAGASLETVTRAVKVLMAVGMLKRKRRPNQSSVYQLLLPMGRPDWSAHMHLYTDTRQRRAHAKKKEREAAAAVAAGLEAGERPRWAVRTASTDAGKQARATSTPGVPDRVHGRPSSEPDSVHGHRRKVSVDGFRTASTTGPYQHPHTYGMDPHTDPEAAYDSPQPQGSATARG